MRTYVVVVSWSLVGSSIKINKLTMSRAITPDTINIDIDQLIISTSFSLKKADLHPLSSHPELACPVVGR